MWQMTRQSTPPEERWDLNDDRLRQLVRLRSQRGRVLSAADEDKLLEEAVTRLDLPLDRAQGIIYAELRNNSISLESDIDNRMLELLTSIAGAKGRLSRRDFERIAAFYASRLKVPVEVTRKKLKRIMEEEEIRPMRAGLIPSRSWFRRIRES